MTETPPRVTSGDGDGYGYGYGYGYPCATADDGTAAVTCDANAGTDSPRWILHVVFARVTFFDLI